MPKKWAKTDPYASYLDGNCRDVSGQIVPCSSDAAVSPPKFAEGDEPETDARDAAANDDGID